MSETARMRESTCQLRVRYGETDQMGFAYYAHFFVWFEVARAELLRQSGMSYREMEHHQVYLPVVLAECRYRRPARYDDLLRITTRTAKPERARLLFEYRVHPVGDEELLATGRTLHAAVDARGKPRRFPEKLLRLLS